MVLKEPKKKQKKTEDYLFLRNISAMYKMTRNKENKELIGRRDKYN